MFSHKITLFVLLTTLLSLSLASPVISLYSGSPLYSGNNPNISQNIDEIKASGFTRVMIWSLHVHSNNDYYLNNDFIVSNGQYVGDAQWPSYLKSLKSNQTSVTEIYLSVGSDGALDIQQIAYSIKRYGTGNDSILYQNFMAIRTALPDVDGIDIIVGTGDVLDINTITQLSVMLGQIGFKVSYCPSFFKSYWVDCFNNTEAQSPGTVSHFNLQCWNIGQFNDPASWQKAIFNETGVNLPVYPGLTPSQSGLAAIEAEFVGWKGEGITGGFLYLYDDILRTGIPASQFADAIKNGLNITSMAMNRNNQKIEY